jgi:hypothetical protein
MNRKIIILSVTALMLCVGTMQAQETSLLVHGSDGTPQSFALGSINKITFSGGKMNVLPTSGTAESIALSEISQLTFAAVGNGGTGISLTDVSELRLYPNPVRDELFVAGDTEIESIAVFNLSGSMLLRTKVQSATATLSLGFLPTGIYVIQVKRANAVNTQKIIKL